MNEKIMSKYFFLQNVFSEPDRKTRAPEVADSILQQENIITYTDTQEIFAFNSDKGLFEQFEPTIKEICVFVRGNLATTHFTNEVISIIKARTFVIRDEIKPALNFIPLENGVFDFETKTLLPHSKDLIFHVKHPIVYNQVEEGTFCLIDDFLIQVTENEVDVGFLKEFIGYCFYRSMPFHTIVILVGAGANGKSVFLGVLQKMLGEKAVCNRTLQDLSEDRFAKADLYLKNANIIGDLPSKALTDTGLIKLASGGDVINAQQKFKSSFEFKPYAKIICAANEVPETPDTSDGFFRRLFIVNFPNSFEGKENRQLLDELCTPENLNIFFQSCIFAFSDALADNYFIKKESTDQKREKYYNFSNSAVAFCNVMLEYDPDSELSTQEIFQAYSDFCHSKKLIKKEESRFFVSLYRHFSNRVFKKRKTIGVSALQNEIRQYFVCGVDWKEKIT